MGKKTNKRTRRGKKLLSSFCPMYDLMDPILEDMYKEYVMLDKEDTKESNEILGMVIEELIEKMKEVDPLFEDIFDRIFYTGSFYDGLKIIEANEYDLNLVLKPHLIMEPVWKRRLAGFASIKVRPTQLDPYTPWLHSASEPNYLDPVAVRSWLQGIATKALNKLEEEGNAVLSSYGIQLNLHQSGPAWTLSIKQLGKTIDIDLVPVIEFTTPSRAIHPPIREGDFRNVCQNKVRDGLGIDKVASYYIKTLFLWELKKYGPEIWMSNKRGCLFMHMLQCLSNALENRKILYIWNTNCNLLETVPTEYLMNGAKQLQKIRNEINSLTTNKDIENLEIVIERLFNPKQQRLARTIQDPV